MSVDAQHLLQYTIVASAFALVMSIWLIGVLWWSSRRAAKHRQLKQRLRFEEAHDDHARVLRLWKDGEEATTTVPNEQLSVRKRLDKLCKDAGWQVPIQTVLLGLVGASCLCFVVGFILTKSPLVGASAAIVVVLGFRGYLSRRVIKRTAQLENQIADALALAGRSLRAGHPLVAAFNLVSEEMPPPISRIFSEICQLQSMGLSLEDAVRSVAAQSGSPDLKLFATSVAIQLRSGGNLADMMDRLAFVIRDRMRLKRRVSILTAQTQFSKRVLVFLPFAMFILLNSVDPDYMEPLYETTFGHVLLCVAGAQVVTGLWAMNRLSQLRY